MTRAPGGGGLGLPRRLSAKLSRGTPSRPCRYCHICRSTWRLKLRPRARGAPRGRLSTLSRGAALQLASGIRRRPPAGAGKSRPATLESS